MLRDFNHWKAYRDSKLFRDIAKGYEDKTKHKIIALTYYGERMVTANKEIKKPEDMKGLKMRIQSSKVLESEMRAFGALPLDARETPFAAVVASSRDMTRPPADESPATTAGRRPSARCSRSWSPPRWRSGSRTSSCR